VDFGGAAISRSISLKTKIKTDLSFDGDRFDPALKLKPRPCEAGNEPAG
jgi:hypothetical protein